ncbi:DNA helicase RecQ [Dysosmobacter sp.]|uniref:DNA helicase RecQ n=1 Tax=Dysosmobacter sp. TaxID=2591382 RepID=UPI002A8BA1C8|nr:DNA helicase RecQ [Dysosmobacter sp.]MDY3282197.1 DNA helicase RecQ [Dysosmobacter sp.]
MTKLDALKTYFGYDSFRPGQEPVIDALLSGRDVLNIMPTGGGKSICYQIPALLLPGVTLVISPLVSLMRDQVTQLVQNGVPAAFLNSSLTRRQYQLAVDRARDGWYKIIYVSPERLETDSFLDLAEHLNISLAAVDEAHCISQWGQDFRPAYLSIPAFLERLPNRPPVGAFTATATPAVGQDIRRLLGLRDPLCQTTGFDRENLRFTVLHPRGKQAELLGLLRRRRGQSGIVYCATRKAVEEVCELLRDAGFSAARYHAGLEAEERKTSQEDFLFGRVQIMVATNAFGMGIDKSDVRWVIHYNMPKDPESYYQEAGRAGRDGAPAECILLYSGSDVYTNRYLIEHSEAAEGVDPETAGLLRQRELDRLWSMVDYCKGRTCLRRFLLRYFGENAPDQCGNCSVCLAQPREAEDSADVRAILRCVEDTGERYGVSLIAAILGGSEDQRIRDRGLDRQETYGLLSNLTQQELRRRIRDLVDSGALMTSGGEYPVLRLTARGHELLGAAPARQRRTAAPKPAFRKLTGNQGELLERLKVLRTDLARRQGVPPFVIFSDKTLRAMAAVMPADQAELLTVEGVGSFKADKYGEAFLAEIAAFAEEA